MLAVPSPGENRSKSSAGAEQRVGSASPGRGDEKFPRASPAESRGGRDGCSAPQLSPARFLPALGAFRLPSSRRPSPGLGPAQRISPFFFPGCWQRAKECRNASPTGSVRLLNVCDSVGSLLFFFFFFTSERKRVGQIVAPWHQAQHLYLKRVALLYNQ